MMTANNNATASARDDEDARDWPQACVRGWRILHLYPNCPRSALGTHIAPRTGCHRNSIWQHISHFRFLRAIPGNEILSKVKTRCVTKCNHVRTLISDVHSKTHHQRYVFQNAQYFFFFLNKNWTLDKKLGTRLYHYGFGRKQKTTTRSFSTVGIV
jgi:hypothetical protein